jgi:hypothetical protein
MSKGVPTTDIGPRSAREVIDAAIRENREWEWVCLGLAVTFAAVGAALLVLGAVRADWGIAGPGVAASALFTPMLWVAMRIRQTNIRVRLLEIPLQKAKTAEEAANIIDAVFRPAARRKSDVAP